MHASKTSRKIDLFMVRQAEPACRCVQIYWPGDLQLIWPVRLCGIVVGRLQHICLAETSLEKRSKARSAQDVSYGEKVCQPAF